MKLLGSLVHQLICRHDSIEILESSVDDEWCLWECINCGRQKITPKPGTWEADR